MILLHRYSEKLKLCLVILFALKVSTAHPSELDYIFKFNSQNSYSNYSTLGLIQNPNARFNPAGTIAFTFSDIDPYYRGSIMSYPFDWAEVAYQYTDVNNALYSLSEDFSGRQTYKDKGFDVKFRILKESSYFPQVALGMRDIAGTGVFSAEYLVASKFIFTNSFIYDFSFGLGWGTLSKQNLSNPLKRISSDFVERTRDSNTQGGELSFGNFFSGNMGVFGGVEAYLPNLKGIRIKLEYDGVDYKKEGFPFGRDSSRFAFESVRRADSNINFGVVFPVNNSIQLRASFVKGNTFNIGFSVTGLFGKKNPLVKKRDPYREIPNKNIIKEVTSRSDLLLYRAALVELRKQNLFLQSANKDNNTFEVAYSQAKYRDFARSAGRVIKTLDAVSPNEIKYFKLVDDNAGMFLNEVTVDRELFVKYQKEDLFPLGAQALTISSVKRRDKDYFAYKPDAEYPAIFYKIAPAVRSQIGGPDGFYFGEVSLGFSSEIKFTRNIGLILQGQAGGVSNFGELKLQSDSVLPRVRSDIVNYLKQSQDFNIKRLQFNMFNNPFNNLYTKISAGILEDMFAGIGGEVLYKPFNQNFALGFEVWSAQQRDYNMLFDLRDYKTITGHLNFYFNEPNSGLLFHLKGGKYLAKDSGITIDIGRRFPSGLAIGGFFSLTDISKEEFGEGSFDKGFYFHIPVEIFFDKFSRGFSSFGLKPLTRDGAAIIAPSFALYGVTYEAQMGFIDRDWSGLYD